MKVSARRGRSMLLGLAIGLGIYPRLSRGVYRPPEQIDQPSPDERGLHGDDCQQAEPGAASPATLDAEPGVHTIDSDGDWHEPSLIDLPVACAAHGPRSSAAQYPADQKGNAGQGENERQYR
jgi:hypothetical protein